MGKPYISTGSRLLVSLLLGLSVLTVPVSSSFAGATQKIPVSAQGSNEAGVSVRVKSVELGGDFTVLDVSISYSGRPGNAQLAHGKTFLEDDNGMRLPLRAPDGNSRLSITYNQPMQGHLVFLGHVDPGARKLRLVFNEGSDGGSLIGPGLSVEISLQPEKNQ